MDELKTAQFWLGDVNFDAGIWTMVENTYPSLSNVQVPLENYIYIPSFPERCLPGKLLMQKPYQLLVELLLIPALIPKLPQSIVRVKFLS